MHTSIFTLLSFAAFSKETCTWLLPISICRLIVALEKHTYIYTLPSMTLFAVYPTYSNPNGVCDVRIVESVPVIATLGEKRGSIRLIVIFFFIQLKQKVGKQPEVMITAHDSAISCLTLSEEGELLATASARGSLIRVFDVKTAHCISSIRRGHLHTSIVNLEWE